MIEQIKKRFKSQRNAVNFSKRLFAISGGHFGGYQNDDSVQLDFTSNHVRSSKYTIFSFLFLNFLEQFRRTANFCYLCIAVIQLCLPDPPVSPITTIFPLTFVVTVSMIKQGYEDILRHRNDNITNRAKVRVVRHKKLDHIESKDVKVGDILAVKNKERFPCDVLLLSTSSLAGKCYVMTANLDGETNLKPKMTVKETRKYINVSSLQNLRGDVQCQNPNSDLHSFSGKLNLVKEYGVESCPIGMDNLALRGTQLFNTDFILGVAVYTGEDTKMSQNSKITANKFSSVEKTLNMCFIAYLALLLTEVAFCIIMEVVYSLDLKYVAWEDDHWYLPDSDSDRTAILLNDGVSYLILYSYIIPASLYVTLEVSRVLNSMFMVWDKSLVSSMTKEPALVNTSDLNEELGQINILFCDKTGTLTENVMLFKGASIAGTMYMLEDLKMHCKKATTTKCSVADVSNHLAEDDIDGASVPAPRRERKIHQFLMALCLCHTGQVNAKEHVKDKELFYGCTNESFIADEDDVDELGESLTRFEYNAPSPDEKAILEGCSFLGMKFAGEDEVTGNCKILDTRSNITSIKVYKKLHTLEFDSDRKRMSVMVQHPNGKIYLICKGADSSVLPLCISGPIQVTQQHMDTCAVSGLRTLVVAMREISAEEVARYEQAMQKALLTETRDRREQMVRLVMDKVEKGLVLLGATALEDRLQDGVPATLRSLSLAGVAVWVLTGDSRETAVNISLSSGHLEPDMSLLDLTHVSSQDRILSKLQAFKNQVGQYHGDQCALIVNGDNIAVILDNHKLMLIFVKVSVRCSAVLCCRLSPLQKSQIVKMMKSSPDTGVTAAIGDGGNDVAMLQEAHVGFGVMGREGRAAVRASDIALSRFQDIKRVMLVHGHWFYYRSAIMIQYFFYKNVACYTTQLFFAFFTNFSGVSLFETSNLAAYNIVYTATPILVFSVLARDIVQEKLLAFPHHYTKLAHNKLLSFKELLSWFLLGLWHALVSFFGWFFYWRDVSDQATVELLGMTVYTTVLLTVSVRLLITTRSLGWPLILTTVLSMVTFVLINLLNHAAVVDTTLLNSLGYDYNTALLSETPLAGDMFMVAWTVMTSIGAWLHTILLTTAALLPDITLIVIRKHWKTITNKTRIHSKIHQIQTGKYQYDH